MLLVGIAGCFIPVIPGPPFSYAAVLLLYFTSETSWDSDFLIFWFIVTLLVFILDYVVPVYGAKKMGGSSYGVWGSALGLLVGLLFFPPFGLIIGPVLGALVGELISGKSGSVAFKAALGSFLGFLAGTILKLTTAIILTYYFIVELF